MIIVISPAKTLDFETPTATQEHTQPDFLDDSAKLIDELRKLEPDQVGKLMSISPKLAVLNSNRYYAWQRPFNRTNAKQAILAFKGDVYTGLDADTLTAAELAFAQDHLRILSGLYGVLRPLDLMQAYRLEMGTQFKNPRGNDLYEFWGDTITQSLNQDLKNQKSDILINLASQEYFKSIKFRSLNARIITPVFKDQKNGVYKIISFFAKKARGLMGRYIIQNRLMNPEDIKHFSLAGYQFNERASSQDEWIFTREKSRSTLSHEKKETIERAKNYIILSNNHSLRLIKPLFTDDATYHSAYFGEYQGRAAIHAMMIRFFARFPDAHWEVAEYRPIEDNGVEFAFVMTGMDASSGERVRRQGLERIYFTPDGLIRHIAICKPDE